jgi:hypothetical protein
VQQLEKAGVVLFGKTNVPLMLADHQSLLRDPYPWDVSRTPGGSSGKWRGRSFGRATARHVRLPGL